VNGFKERLSEIGEILKLLYELRDEVYSPRSCRRGKQVPDQQEHMTRPDLILLPFLVFPK
jgi:hypothetical protein